MNFLPSAYKPHGFIHKDEEYGTNGGLDGGADGGVQIVRRDVQVVR
jgi:hypothetical protein